MQSNLKANEIDLSALFHSWCKYLFAVTQFQIKCFQDISLFFLSYVFNVISNFNQQTFLEAFKWKWITIAYRNWINISYAFIWHSRIALNPIASKIFGRLFPMVQLIDTLHSICSIVCANCVWIAIRGESIHFRHRWRL